MLITRRKKAGRPIENPTGELIYEMIGRPEHLGKVTKHSVGYVILPPNCSSPPHCHPEAEETYYILKGQPTMYINDKEYFLSPGDVILIHSQEHHQILNIKNARGGNVDFIVICAPAWEPNNTVLL